MNIIKRLCIFNYMVNNEHTNELDQIFHALADPTRRKMIRMMADKERTVSELAEPFDMSLAAISKHIKVLEQAHLLNRKVQGRTHICHLDGQALSKATSWLRVYEQFWNKRFDLLETELMKAKKEEH